MSTTTSPPDRCHQGCKGGKEGFQTGSSSNPARWWWKSREGGDQLLLPKETTRNMEITEIPLGSSGGQRDGWTNRCCLSGPSKVLTAVHMLCWFVLPLLLRKWNMLSKSSTWILFLWNQSSSPGISWHTLKQQTFLIHLHSIYHY